MKKTFALILTAAMVFALSACSQQNAPAAQTQQPAATTNAAQTSAATKAPEFTWPEKTIEVVIPANPGGDTDTTSRSLSIPLAQSLNRPVVIKNMAGGTGTIAANDVKTSAADGYKMLYYHTDTILGTLLKRVDYDWEDAFDIAGVIRAGSSNCVFVHKNSPYNSIAELVEAAKNKKLKFAMETGGLVHLLILDLEKQAGVEFNKVDLGGSAARVAALLGEQVDVVITIYGSARDYVENGDFKCLGLIGEERNPFLPDLPTLKENGVDSSYEHFYFFAFPKGTDKAIIEKFSGALKGAVADEDYIKVMEKYCFKPELLLGQDAIDYMHGIEDHFNPLVDIMLASQK